MKAAGQGAMVIHVESRLWRGGGVVKDEMKIKF